MELPKRLRTESMLPFIVLGHIAQGKHVSWRAEGVQIMA